jgi:secretion/DNA translocation related TadE-like protein
VSASGCASRRTIRPLRGDSGSASLWLLALGLAVLSLVGGVMAVGTAIIARHQAQAAADLGALAGALRASGGTLAACERAREIVVANRAELTRCTVVGLDVIIDAEVPAVGGWGTAHGRARAGPA